MPLLASLDTGRVGAQRSCARSVLGQDQVGEQLPRRGQVGVVGHRVRLLGIDTPESVAENRPDQCYGEESSDYLTSVLPEGTEITLIRDVEARDQFDRLLAYVVRSSDQLFVNLDLIERGYAGVLIYEPNSFYRDLFEDAEDEPFRGDVGLWGVCGGPDVPLD